MSFEIQYVVHSLSYLSYRIKMVRLIFMRVKEKRWLFDFG